MNWSRSSRGVLLAVVLLLAAVAPVAAVSVSGSPPQTAQVGQQQDPVTFTITEPFGGGAPDAWDLRGTTELTAVTWVVTTYDNTGAKVDQQSFTGQSFTYNLDAADGVTKVTVELTGTTPDVSTWQYDPAPTFTYATFERGQQGGSFTTLESYDGVRQYTEKSQTARSAITKAKSAIDDAGGSGANLDSARSDLQNAISAYNDGSFDLAVNLATQAEDEANSAASTSQRNRWILIGAGVLVVIVIVVAAAYWYLQQRETYDRLG